MLTTKELNLTTFESIPKDVKLHIWSFLNTKERFSAKHVCKNFKEISNFYEKQLHFKYGNQIYYTPCYGINKLYEIDVKASPHLGYHWIGDSQYWAFIKIPVEDIDINKFFASFNYYTFMKDQKIFATELEAIQSFTNTSAFNSNNTSYPAIYKVICLTDIPNNNIVKRTDLRPIHARLFDLAEWPTKKLLVSVGYEKSTDQPITEVQPVAISDQIKEKATYMFESKDTNEDLSITFYRR